MIGVVVITHGRLAQELLNTAELMIGPLPGVKAISIDSAAQSSNDIRRQLEAALREVNSGSGVIILTDMFGGTPSNLSLSFLGKKDVEVITGVNLPMLIKLIEYRKSLNLQEIKAKVVHHGRENILIASQMLGDKSETGELGNTKK